MNASSIAKFLGSRGGRARARILSPMERAKIASSGGVARAASILAARRISANFRYLRSMKVLHPSPVVIVQKKVSSPLPNFYGR